MGILDDAIREHLDLKRKHGAREAELREIEDEALGSSDQPDPFAAGGELFGDVSAGGATEASPAGPAPAAIGDLSRPEVGNEEPTKLVEPEALRREPQTPPPDETLGESAASEPELGSFGEPAGPRDDVIPIPGQAELPGQDEIPGQERLDQPLEADRPSAAPEPEPPSTSESLEALIAEEEPFPEDSAAPPPAGPAAEPVEAPAPEPEELLSATPEPESEEVEAPPRPEGFVPEPPPPPPEAGAEPPGRARGRIDVPTEEHPPPGQTGGVPAVPPAEPGVASEPEREPEPPSESGGPAVYDFESDEEPLAADTPEEPRDEFEALGPADEEMPYLDEEEPLAGESVSGPEPPLEDPDTEVRPALEDEEVYEGGALDPEEAYEEDEGEEGLWFEKGPPKDFDFDD
jgi:hypothetical protein